jgi:hypothetical protein
MDQLDDRDRELMLLHYFNALTFAEAGARMELSEDAARKRVGRALDKLRGHLGRRGLTSTSTALGLLLSQTPVVAAPVGFASAVTTTALTAAPTGIAATTVALVSMSKITAPIVSAALAAGLTGLIWITTVADTVSATELAALRDENARLAQATAANASSESIARIANEYSAQATSIARALTERQAHQTTNPTASRSSTAAPSTSSSAVTPRGHRDHGTATPRDAHLTFAWAGDISDPVILSTLIYFDPAARAKANEVLATMPDAIRAQYPTPEAFYGLLMAASMLGGPPPGADLLEKAQTVELQPGRAVLRPGEQQFQQTPNGWKYVLPLDGVEGLPSLLNSQTLAKLAKR